MAIDDTVITYKPVEVSYERKTKSEILKVEMLGSSIKIEDEGDFQSRYLVLKLGLKCLGSPLENVIAVESVDVQRSLDSTDPTDFYYRAVTFCKEGFSAGYGEPEFIEIELKYFIDQRDASEKDKEWQDPTLRKNECINHLSFDSGMFKGYNTWRMYKLDLGNLKNVKFEFVKLFAYVQGEVVDIK